MKSCQRAVNQTVRQSNLNEDRLVNLSIVFFRHVHIDMGEERGKPNREIVPDKHACSWILLLLSCTHLSRDTLKTDTTRKTNNKTDHEVR